MEAYVAYREVPDPNSLDPIVQLMAQHVTISIYKIFERAYFSRLYGRLDDKERGRYRRIMRSTDNVRISNLRSDRFSQDFYECLTQCNQEEVAVERLLLAVCCRTGELG